MPAPMMVEKLNTIERTYKDLTQKLADPDIVTNSGEVQRIAKARADLEVTVEVYHRWQELQAELKTARTLLREDDPEIRELAEAEVKMLEEQIEEQEKRLTLLLLPRDPNDDKNIMLEIRAGTGGDEAAIFAGDLVRMYSRYADSQGWKVRLFQAEI
jgi:peptide chain release factor 1